MWNKDGREIQSKNIFKRMGWNKDKIKRMYTNIWKTILF